MTLAILSRLANGWNRRSEPVADAAAYGRMCPLSGHSSCLPKVSWEGGEHSFVIRKRPLSNCNIHLHQG